MRKAIFPLQRTSIYFHLTLGSAFILVLLYTFIYIYEPFSGSGNDLASNLLTIFSSLASAISATMLWAFYSKSDAPRRVWNRFAIALWLWLVAETVWAFYNMRDGEVPIGWADFFWVLAYGFMFGALFQQHTILSFDELATNRRRMIWMVIPYTLLTFLLVSILVNFFYPLPFITNLVNGFYPLGDFLVGILALWLIRIFRGGTFIRPWVSLILFAVTDFLYFVLEYTGVYSWSVDNGNFLSAVTDILYFSSYLAITVGFLGQWLSLRYSFLSFNSTE